MGTKIILAVCFLPCLFLMYGFLYFEGKQKGNILLGVTLWPGADKDEAVLKITHRFKREMNSFLVLSLLLFAGTCTFTRDSLVLSTQMIWLVFIMVIFFVPLAKGNQRMKTLKRERTAGGEAAGFSETEGNERAAGSEPGKVYVDLKAAAAPKEKPFFKLSLIGALFGALPVILEPILVKDSFYGWWTELTLIIMFLAGIICLLVQYWFWHLKTDIISYRSEVNIQLARVKQYQWSRFWCVMVWCNTLFTFILWYGLRIPKIFIYIMLAGMILYMGILGITAFIAERNVRKVYGKYAEEAGISVEDDEHWLYGMLYYNKNDKRFMVNKRVGIGTTVNMAKTSAKIFMGVVLGGTLALIIWSSGWVLLEDFAPISLKMEDTGVVSSQYKEEYRLEIPEIESAELVDELPRMSKRVGSAMDTILKGSFMAQDYSSCKVCVRRKKPPFLKVTATDGKVYYLNDEEQEVTRVVYEELSELLMH